MGAPCCLYRRSPRWGSKNQKFYENNFIFGYGEREPQIGPREPKKKNSKNFGQKKKRLVKKKNTCVGSPFLSPLCTDRKKKSFMKTILYSVMVKESPRKALENQKKKIFQKILVKKKGWLKKKISIKYRYRYFYI